MTANTAAMDIKPGSMGRPLPAHRGHRQASKAAACVIQAPDVDGGWR